MSCSSGQNADDRALWSLRLWPGVAAVSLQWLAWAGLPLVTTGPVGSYAAFFGALLGGLAVFVWWAFFSKASRWERWGGTFLILTSLAVTPQFVHESIATGMQALLFFAYAVPVLSLALVLWAAASRGLATGPRRMTMVATILLACAMWTLVRSEGITGAGSAQFAFRWTPSVEERFLSRETVEPARSEPGSAPVSTEPVWPGFRGPGRDSVVRDVQVGIDWESAPPIEVWRRPVGPGISSFAVRDDLLYTQEQRGEEEIVSCYRVSSGEPVWLHRDATRFWDSHAGAGPRSTPALDGSRVYSFGATGILNALDSATGDVAWSRNLASETETGVPDWGFASSPLVVGDAVVVAVAGTLAAYHRDTGEPLWLGPAGGDSYSSPQLVTFDGTAQVLLASGSGVASMSAGDHRLLWEYSWPGSSRIVQPARAGAIDLLISDAEGFGIRRVAVERQSEGWAFEERWTSSGLKPYFNDFVVHEGRAFGFDGRILSCIDLADGERQWKGGRYGHGQLILLADQDLLLVLSENGELALVDASAERFRELSRFPAIQGKTWNHPALAGNLLLVRNGQEMAAFRLPPAEIERSPLASAGPGR